jgi:hypothetical protein
MVTRGIAAGIPFRLRHGKKEVDPDPEQTGPTLPWSALPAPPVVPANATRLTCSSHDFCHRFNIDAPLSPLQIDKRIKIIP